MLKGLNHPSSPVMLIGTGQMVKDVKSHQCVNDASSEAIAMAMYGRGLSSRC